MALTLASKVSSIGQLGFFYQISAHFLFAKVFIFLQLFGQPGP
jgi:hypothetical protein